MHRCARSAVRVATAATAGRETNTRSRRPLGPLCGPDRAPGLSQRSLLGLLDLSSLMPPSGNNVRCSERPTTGNRLRGRGVVSPRSRPSVKRRRGRLRGADLRPCASILVIATRIFSPWDAARPGDARAARVIARFRYAVRSDVAPQPVPIAGARGRRCADRRTSLRRRWHDVRPLRR